MGIFSRISGDRAYPQATPTTQRKESLWSKARSETVLPRRKVLIGGVAGIAALVIGYQVLNNSIGSPDLETNYGVEPPLGTGSLKGSYFVATFANMLREEADNWCPSNWVFDRRDTCGFDIGEARVFERLSQVLRDYLARRDEGDDEDHDLDKAVELIYTGRSNKFLFSTPSNYREAADLIDAYNKRVASGEAYYSLHMDSVSQIIMDLYTALSERHGALQKLDQHRVEGDARARYAESLGVVKATRDILMALEKDFKEPLHNQSMDPLSNPTDGLPQAINTANYILKAGVPTWVMNGNSSKTNDIGTLAGEIANLMQDLMKFESGFGAASNRPGMVVRTPLSGPK